MLKKLESRASDRTPWLRLPYWRALKAMAYANLDINEAKKNLRTWGFIVPSPSKKKIAGDYLKEQYEIFGEEAKALRVKYDGIDINLSQNQGIFPLYEYILKRDAPEHDLNWPEMLMRDILDDIYSVPLRKAVTILDWKGVNRGGITNLLRSHPLAPDNRWTLEHVNMFMDFFWDTQRMTIKDWRLYATCDRTERLKKCDHLQYLIPLTDGLDKAMISWHDYAVADIDSATLVELVGAELFNTFRNETDPERKLRTGKVILDAVANLSKIQATQLQMGGAKDNALLADLELVVQEVQAKRKPLLLVSEIDGSVSDPKDTSFGKDEYLDNG